MESETDDIFRLESEELHKFRRLRGTSVKYGLRSHALCLDTKSTVAEFGPFVLCNAELVDPECRTRCILSSGLPCADT